MSWSSKKQFTYIGFLILFLAIFVVLPFYLLNQKEPTCFDGKKNGIESGVDCGGSCQKVCAFQAAKPIIHWDESFEIRPGIWSAAAYVENPNDAYALNVPYKFKLLDSDGVLVAERRGGAFIPPRQTFVVFESGIEVGNRKPGQEFFEFSESAIDWRQASGANAFLNTSSASLLERNNSTRLSAIISNPTTDSVNGILAWGILYDINGNALAVSESFISKLEAGDAETITFTWPEELASQATKKEVLYAISIE